MEERPVKLSQRSGTSDSGKLYELEVAALLALRCIENPKVKHAWFASNVNHAYDFDDVILYVKDEKDLCTTYLMQLKHQDFPKNIPRKDFLYDAKTKKKSNTSEDFSLFKYQRSYLQIKESLEGSVSEDEKDGLIASLIDADEIFYVLYTNRPLGAKYEFFNASEAEWNFLDTSDGGCNVYGFNPDALEMDGDFLRHLLLFTQQEHVTKMGKLIKKELKRVMEAAKVDLSSLLKKYLDFVGTRITGVKNSTFDALTKNDLEAHLTSWVLDEYLVELPLNSPSRPEFSLWNEIVDGKVLIVVEATELTREFLTSYLSAKIAEHCTLDHQNQELSKQNFYKKFPDLKPTLMKTVGEGDLTPAGIYQALWLQKKVPVLVQARTSKDFKRIQAALHLSRESSYPVVVLTSSGIHPTSNCFFDLNHLDEKHQDLILDHPIALQERPGARLRDIVNKSMYKMIKCGDIIDIISNRYNIGNAQAAIFQFYVPRAVSKVLFRPQSLRKIESKFLVRGMDEETFAKFLQNHELKRSKFVLETQVASRKDYHELSFANKMFELRCSYASTKNLREHQVVQLHAFDDLPDCCWLQPNELLELSPCVISANPGMGKTEFFNYASANAPTKLWILKVNLNEHHDYYKTLKDGEKTALDHLKHFHGDPRSDLTERVFSKFVNQKEVLVLLDGFDEISMTYKDEVTSIATSLHQSGYKVWVSTRPVTKAHLEDALNTVSRTLKPLVVEDQKNLLIKYFAHLAEDETQMRTVAEFVERLLKAAAANLNDSDNRFTCLPLQTKLLADVFKKDLERILATGVFAFNDKFDLIFLYDSFLDEKTNILCRKFGEIYRDMRELFGTLQQLYALQVVFPEHLLEKLRVQDELKNYDKMWHMLQREGVVMQQEDVGVFFVHRSFAEFLAAKWLYCNYQKNDVQDFIKSRFQSWSDFLFGIFDRYMAKDLPLHLSIINGNKREALELIRSDPDSTRQTDSGGRTILHLISCYGVRHTSNFKFVGIRDEMPELIDAIPEDVITDAKDDLLGFSALDYAFYSNTLAVADKLCEKLDKVRVSLSLYQKYSILASCSSQRYNRVFLVVLKYFARKELLQKLAKPYVFIEDHYRIWGYSSEYKSKTVLDFVRSTCSDDDIGFVAAFGSTDELLLLLDQGVDANKADGIGYIALHYAIIHDRLENTNLLLDATVAINYVNSNGTSALHLALQNQSLEVAQALINKGADVNLPDGWLTASFMYACKIDQTDLLKKMLPMVSNINLQSRIGESALHLAVQNGNDEHTRLEIVQLLIEKGVDVNLRNTRGNTVLHQACWSKNFNKQKKFCKATALALLQHPEIQLNLVNTFGQTALDLARENQDVDREVLMTLEEKSCANSK